jgi:hypothetical protein
MHAHLAAALNPMEIINTHPFIVMLSQEGEFNNLCHCLLKVKQTCIPDGEGV